MDDRHKTPRVYVSGAHQRRLEVKCNKQIEEVISQIPKLTNYLSSSRQSTNVLKNEIENENIDILKFNQN